MIIYEKIFYNLYRGGVFGGKVYELFKSEYYNTSPETADEVRMTEKKEGSFLNFPPEKDDKIKCNPSKFKHYIVTPPRLKAAAAFHLDNSQKSQE